MPSLPHFRRLHFSLRDRLVTYLSEAFFDNITYTVRHGLIQGMKRKGGLGFLPSVLVSSTLSPSEEQFLRNLDLKGKVVYDIGAYHGITTLFFASRARAVISYEPHPANHRRLIENIGLNRLDNVTVFQCGIGECEGSLELACDPRMPGAASGDPAIISQVRASLPDAQSVHIAVVRLDDEIERHNLPFPHLVKIDIEGMEISALRGMPKLLTRYRPQLYLEMHGATKDEKTRKAAEIFDYLALAGYHSLQHVETRLPIMQDNLSMMHSGHWHCVPA